MGEALEENRNTGPRVGSVASAVAVLRHLSAHPAGAGVNPIARALGIGTSSCFNILKTLTAEQFLDFDPVTKLYTLGPGAVALARRALDPGGAFALLRDELERLAQRFQLTASLWRITRTRAVLLGFAESEAATRIHLSVGQRLPLLTGALGRCVAAHAAFPADDLESRLGDIKWANRPSLEDYRAQMALTRTRGWAIDRDAFMQGVTNIAAPALDEQGRVSFGVTATTFTGQHDADGLEAIGEGVRKAADTLAARVFGRRR